MIAFSWFLVGLTLGLSNDKTHVLHRVELSPSETVHIQTRDGVHLRTTVYFPNESQFPKPWDVVYEKTPYNADGLSNNAANFVGQGFAYLGQDCRGRFQSTGKYSFWRTSGNDTIDSINWIKKQPWATGFVSFFGISADAIAQYTDFGGLLGPSSDDLAAFKAIKIGFPIVGNSIVYQSVFQGGAFRESLIAGWLTGIEEPSMIEEIKSHEAFSSWWYSISGEFESHWKLFDFPMIHLGGFYDIFSSNQIRTAIAINETGKGNARGQQILIVNPGGHCGGGAIKWPNASFGETFAMETIAPKLFEAAFTAAKKNSTMNIHDFVDWNVLFYMLGPGTIGSKGNYWVTGKSFPTARSLVYYLGDGTLDLKLGKSGTKSYVYDPLKPVQTYGGNNLILQPCGPQDQSKNENGRKDVLAFVSEKLRSRVAIVGVIVVELHVTSSARDTDFTAKLIDVFPDGKKMLVQDGIARMRWRNGPYPSQMAPPMKAGTVYVVNVTVGFMAYMFNPGHRIQVSVSSSNFPRFSVNWNSGLPLVNGSNGGVIADNVVGYGSTWPSRLILPQVQDEDVVES